MCDAFIANFCCGCSGEFVIFIHKITSCSMSTFTTRKEVTRVSEAQTESINKEVVHTKYTET